MTKIAIAKEITDLEQQLHRMKSRLARQAARNQKRPFAGLRGLWKGAGDFTEEDIKNAEVRLPEQP